MEIPHDSRHEGCLQGEEMSQRGLLYKGLPTNPPSEPIPLQRCFYKPRCLLRSPRSLLRRGIIPACSFSIWRWERNNILDSVPPEGSPREPERREGRNQYRLSRCSAEITPKPNHPQRGPFCHRAKENKKKEDASETPPTGKSTAGRIPSSGAAPVTVQ